jgi:hypothetical protein
MLPFIAAAIRKRQGSDFKRFKDLVEAGELSV